MADDCDPIRAEINQLEELLSVTPKFEEPDSEPEPGFPGGRPQPNPEFRELQQKIGEAKNRLRNCEGRPVVRRDPPPPPPPIPLTLTAVGLTCFDQSDPNSGIFIDIEDDEPYVLAFAVDFSRPDNSKLTLIGPISGADDDEGGVFSVLPSNKIWGLNNEAQLISSAINFICIIAFMENDGANPDIVRTGVENSLRLSLISEVIPFTTGLIGRPELVSRLINAMNGFIPLFKVAVPDPDDQIGSAQELSFSQNELDGIYRSRSAIDKKLSFEGDDAKYDLFLRISP
jgi:hypothetical protein